MLRSPKPSKVTIPMIIMTQWIGEDPRNHGVLSHQRVVLSSICFLILGIFRSGSWGYSEWNSQCVDFFSGIPPPNFFPWAIQHPWCPLLVRNLSKPSSAGQASGCTASPGYQQLKSERRSNNEGLTTGGCMIFSAGLGSKKNSQRI